VCLPHPANDSFRMKPYRQCCEPQHPIACENEVVVPEQIVGELFGSFVHGPVDLHRPATEIDVQISATAVDDADRLAARSGNSRSARKTCRVDLGKALGATGDVIDDLPHERCMPDRPCCDERAVQVIRSHLSLLHASGKEARGHLGP